ncbi:hypothetical protein A5874_001592, partial [Enterococcus faecium]
RKLFYLLYLVRCKFPKGSAGRRCLVTEFN